MYIKLNVTEKATAPEFAGSNRPGLQTVNLRTKLPIFLVTSKGEA